MATVTHFTIVDILLNTLNQSNMVFILAFILKRIYAQIFCWSLQLNLELVQRVIKLYLHARWNTAIIILFTKYNNFEVALIFIVCLTDNFDVCKGTGCIEGLAEN